MCFHECITSLLPLSLLMSLSKRQASYIAYYYNCVTCNPPTLLPKLKNHKCSSLSRLSMVPSDKHTHIFKHTHPHAHLHNKKEKQQCTHSDHYLYLDHYRNPPAHSPPPDIPITTIPPPLPTPAVPPSPSAPNLPAAHDTIHTAHAQLLFACPRFEPGALIFHCHYHRSCRLGTCKSPQMSVHHSLLFS